MNKTIKGLTVEIGGDTTKLGKALEDVNKRSSDLSSELGRINKLLKMDPGNTDLLAQKQKVLAEAVENTGEKLEKLKEAEKQVQKQFKKGEVSEAQVRELQREIIATEKKMESYEDATRETTQALRGMGDETEKVEKSSGNLGSTLATVAKTGLTAVTAAVGAAITGLVAAAESTREYRAEMGKLEAAYASSGYSTETAAAAYKTLVGVIGETDQSVEAAQQIALLASSEKEVAEWSELAAGVVGKFGDALQPEMFFESANETIKLGEATGGFTQMLEGCGMNVEAFNKKLGRCKTEQEKQAYMLDVTRRALGSAGEAYNETNAEVIRANEANDQWMQSLSGIGEVIEPIVTDVKLMGASLLSDLVPGVQQLAEAFRGLLNGDTDAAGGIGKALSGMISGLLQKITETLPAVAQMGISLVSTLAQTVSSQLPSILSMGGQIVGNLLSGIAQNLPNILQMAINTISGFVSGLQTYLPLVLAKGAEILGNLGQGIAQNLPGLVNQALDVVMRFAETIYNNAPKLIQIGFDLLGNLVSGIMSSLPALISKAPEIISKFANVINDNFPTILKKGVELVWQIIKGLISAIPTLIKNIPKIITAIVDVWEAFNWLNLGKKAITFMRDGIKSMFSAIKTAGKGVMDSCTNALKNLPQNLLDLGKKAISGLGSALKSGWSTVKSGAMTIFNGIVNYFKTLPSKLLSVGKDLVKGLWNGISDMTGWIIGKIQGFGENVLSGIKNFFGIKSPSTVMRDEVGKMLDEGLAIGLTANAKTPVKAMQQVASGVLGAAPQEVDPVALSRTISAPRVRTAAAVSGASGAVDLSAMLDKLDGIYERLNHLQVVTETGALVGAIVDKMDGALASRQALAMRGV